MSFVQFNESSERENNERNSSQSFCFRIAPLMPISSMCPSIEFKRPHAGLNSGFIPSKALPQIDSLDSSIPGQLNRVIEVNEPQPQEQIALLQTISILKSLRVQPLSPQISLPDSESSLLSPPPSPPSNYVSEFIQRCVDTQHRQHRKNHKLVKAPSVAKSQTPRAKPKSSKPMIRQSGNDDCKHRVCISCHITQTPCWRPSWDPKRGQLCNSCGLRYRKTKIRCSNYECSKVPSKLDLAALREEAQGRPLHCPHCNAPLIQDK